MPRTSNEPKPARSTKATAAGAQPDPAATRKKRGPVPGTPSARNGGQAVKAKYGPDFYRAIGQRGGKASRERRGLEFYAEIGRQGGTKTRQRLGKEHYQRIGKLGGSSNGHKPPATPDAGPSAPAER